MDSKDDKSERETKKQRWAFEAVKEWGIFAENENATEVQDLVSAGTARF